MPVGQQNVIRQICQGADEGPQVLQAIARVHQQGSFAARDQRDAHVQSVPDMADPRDVLLIRAEAKDPEKLLTGTPVIGTDSPRRREDIRRLCPGAVFKSLRGNVPTRVKKLRAGEYDAIVLAKAGLDRLGEDLTGIHERILSIEEVTPAPCQGILAVECRAEDTEMLRLIK